MSKVLVNVKICDNNNELFSQNIQVEINSIDYLIIKDCMNACSYDDYDESWDRLIQTIESNHYLYLPKDWYVGNIEFLEKTFEKHLTN